MSIVPGVTITNDERGAPMHVNIDLVQHPNAIPALEELGLLSESNGDADAETSRNKKAQAHEQLLFQYDKLRSEILQNDTLVLQIFGASLIIISAIMSFAFRTETSDIVQVVLFTSATIMSGLGMNQSMERVKNTYQIAFYMRTFIERYTDHIRWETWLQNYRTKRNNHGDEHLNSILFVYIVIAFANMILSIIYTFNSWEKLDNEYFRIGVHNVQWLKYNYFTVLFSVASIFVFSKIFFTYKHNYHKYVWDDTIYKDVSNH